MFSSSSSFNTCNGSAWLKLLFLKFTPYCVPVPAPSISIQALFATMNTSFKQKNEVLILTTSLDNYMETEFYACATERGTQSIKKIDVLAFYHAQALNFNIPLSQLVFN